MGGLVINETGKGHMNEMAENGNTVANGNGQGKRRLG
jgi:hypothetical protein